MTVGGRVGRSGVWSWVSWFCRCCVRPSVIRSQVYPYRPCRARCAWRSWSLSIVLRSHGAGCRLFAGSHAAMGPGLIGKDQGKRNPW